MHRTASAAWSGGLTDGKGFLTTGSTAISELRYGFTTRFGTEVGTNPEELIGAAHAGCFAMALSGQLGNRGMTAEKLDVKATVAFDKLDAGWTVTGIHLDLVATIPNADAALFQEAAAAAKAGCPISRLLAPGTTITLDARLG